MESSENRQVATPEQIEMLQKAQDDTSTSEANKICCAVREGMGPQLSYYWIDRGTCEQAGGDVVSDSKCGH